ncbi:Uncharacterised protein [Mycobacterium tuberculosis]|nr:Uncharacterised protein [Mycobacterium tuberculosis]
MAIPSLLTKFFSASLSCTVSSTFGSGSTGRRADRIIAVDEGMFSNS